MMLPAFRMLCLFALLWPAPAMAADAVTDVTRIFNQWMESFSGGNGETIDAFYEPGAVVVSPLVPQRMTTRPERLKHFAKLVALPKLKMSVKEWNIRAFEGAAMISGTSLLTYEINTVPISIPFRFTMIFSRRGDNWLIVEDHTSAIPTDKGL